MKLTALPLSYGLPRRAIEPTSACAASSQIPATVLLRELKALGYPYQGQ
jgi:hypothetical protein